MVNPTHDLHRTHDQDPDAIDDLGGAPWHLGYRALDSLDRGDDAAAITYALLTIAAQLGRMEVP